MKKVKNKRLLAALVSAAMVITAIPVGMSALAAEAENDATAEQEYPRVIGSSDYYMPGISVANILYPDGTLKYVAYDSNTGKATSQTVAENVKSAQTVVWNEVYSSYVGSTAYWDHYLVQDEANTLWSWGVMDKQQEKMVDNVVSYSPSAALLADGKLVDADTPDTVMLENVKEMTFVKPDGAIYALQNDGTLTEIKRIEPEWHVYEIVQETIDTGVSSLLNDEAYIKDGATYSIFGQDRLADFIAQDVVYEGSTYYLVDQNSALYEALPAANTYAEATVNSMQYELKLITEEFDRFYVRDKWVAGYVTKSGDAFSFDGFELDIPFPANEIVKQTFNLTLKTDGTLWNYNNEKVLDGVADVSDDGEFIVRTDGSVWNFDGEAGKAIEIVTGDGTLTDPTNPTDPTEPTDPTDPSTDGSKPADDGETTTAAGSGNGSGNAGNPSTGDSMIVISAGAAALAAAGALVLLRKKAR